MKKWLFAGVHKRGGTREVYTEQMTRLAGITIFHALSGNLCYPHADGPYIACMSRLPGIGHTAFAYFDPSVCNEPRSAATVFIPSLYVGPHTILAGIADKFPFLLERVPYLDATRAETVWLHERDRRGDRGIIEARAGTFDEDEEDEATA